MNDKELADKVVELGVVEDQFMAINYSLDAETLDDLIGGFVRDWRVAGALMEKIYEKRYSFMIMQMPDGEPIMTIQQPLTTENNHKNWARNTKPLMPTFAQMGACVEALS